MNTFNNLLSRALTVMNERIKEMNTATRIGSLLRDILLFLQNMVLGIILKGDKANVAAIKATSNPKRGDTYKALDTGHYWTYDGSGWNDIGEIIPKDIVDRLPQIINYTTDTLPLITDKSNKILYGWDKVNNLPVIPNLFKLLEGKVDKTLLTTELVETLNFDEAYHYIQNDEWLIAYIDADNKVLYGINRNKQFIVLGQELKNDTQTNTFVGNTNQSSISVPFPTNLCRVDLYDFDLGVLNVTKNKAYARIKFNDFSGNYFDKRCIISYQGNTSIWFDKKNFSFDLLNEDDSSFKVKFGDWIEIDSGHFKADYIDVTHSLNVLAARKVVETYNTRPFATNRPYRVPFVATDKTVLNRFDSGAKCAIDGFPFEMYINGQYWGLYTWNIKKDRANYQMNKSDKTQILLEMSGASKIIPPIDWTRWEIRNPKMKNIDGDKLSEGQEPEDGKVKTAILDFFDWAGSVAVSVKNGNWHVRGVDTGIALTGSIAGSTVYASSQGFWYIQGTKTAFTLSYPEFDIADWEARIDVNYWIDFIILTEFFGAGDLKAKNVLMAFYNGKVSPMLYDLDSIYGLYSNGSGFFNNTNWVVQNGNSNLTQPIFALFSHLFKDKISERYAFLRSSGVLSVDAVVNATAQWMRTIGVKAYEKDQKRWPAIPSNGYNVYLSVGHISDWLTKRLVFLDNHYGYNK